MSNSEGPHLFVNRRRKPAPVPFSEFAIQITLLFLVAVFAAIIHYVAIRPSDIEPPNTAATSGKFRDENDQEYRPSIYKTNQAYSSGSYPITNQPKIDQILNTSINQIQKSFVNSTENTLKTAHQFITYSYLPLSDRFVSIILHETQSAPNQPIANQDHFWTFNLATGEILKLGSVLRDRSVLNSFGNDQLVDELLKTNFAVDRNNQKLIMMLNGATKELSFEFIKRSLRFDISKEMFGLSPFSDKKPDSVDCNVTKCLALTFDDGPGAYTDRLLDILSQKNAKASFFVLGHRADGYRAHLSRMAREGHDVGSHSWNHKNLPTFSYAQIAEDLTLTTNTIQNYTGERVRFFRPPYGNINNSVQQITSDLGQRIILWSIDPQDWRYKDAWAICDHTVNRVQPGSIILLHDIYSTSVDAAACIIDSLSYDYTFVNLTTLLK